eukprot:TRINITY_DN4526_c0_g1_i3.p1 TRINITY_DN4526_c0_g1~~TRINITY_DN4526_c0_g1_i3.p1  ORF type:complete len:327 (-),score=59.94 TRINITY_DN4526_c0_g1_i3:888-1868(-)
MEIVFKGATYGNLADNVDGCIQSNLQGDLLDGGIILSIMDSLGDFEDLRVVTRKDLFPFVISIRHPDHLDYQLFYYNRGVEYGKKHCYYEAIVHAFPERVLREGATARYIGRDNEGLSMVHIPGTVEICAFVESLRGINDGFLKGLRDKLMILCEEDIPEEVIDEFISGAFRSASVQMHFGGPSLPLELAIHQDHVFSALHMALTLNGSRTVGFWKSLNDIFEMVVTPGNVYMSTPAAIFHAVSTNKLNTQERSISIQFRTFLSVESTKILQEKITPLCSIISEFLADNLLSLPSEEHYHETLAIIKSHRTTPTEEFIQYSNVTTE